MHAATLTAVVVLPTPPFWFAMAYTVPTRCKLAPIADGRLLPSGKPGAAVRSAASLRRRAVACAQAPPAADTARASRPPLRRDAGDDLAPPRTARPSGSQPSRGRAPPRRAGRPAPLPASGGPASPPRTRRRATARAHTPAPPAAPRGDARRPHPGRRCPHATPPRGPR